MEVACHGVPLRLYKMEMGRSLGARGRCALSPVLLLACTPSLEVPLDADIVCASNADCPDARVCQMVVGRCIDPTIVDDEAPVLLAATALDTTLVVLDFSERIDPGSVSVASFTLSPPLAITDATVEPSLRQVRLVTELQTPGEEYTVTTSGVVDLANNAIADEATQTFNGFGAAPDREPPTILAPRGALPLKAQEVTLVWTRRALARSYTVEVAIDPAFTQVLDGFPVTVDDPDSSYTHTFSSPVRHYWRVRANTTTAGAYGSGSFDRIGSAVHVYCPAAATCSDVDSQGRPLPGNISAPLQTIVGAVRLARALGILEIRIAARGSADAYREHILVGTLSLYGGYDATFSSADATLRPTIIEDDDSAAVYVFGSSLQQTIEGLTLRSQRSVALVVASGMNLNINGNDIAGGTFGADVTGVCSLLFTRNSVRSYPGSNGSGLRIAATTAVVTNNTFVVDACTTGPCNNPVGVDGVLASLLFADNTITLAGSGVIRLTDSFVNVELNRITTGEGASAALEFIADADLGQSSIRNNVLMTGPTLASNMQTFGILARDPAALTTQTPFMAVANNLIYAGGGDGTSIAVSDGLIGSIYVNNIMLTGPGTNRFCLYENWPDKKIANFRNNLLLECPTALYRDVSDLGTDNRTAIADINNEATTTQNGSPATIGGNMTAPNLASVGFADFPADVHLTADTPANIRLNGFNAALNACGPGSFWGCGGVTNDLSQDPRTCPTAGVDCFSVGPYELDP